MTQQRSRYSVKGPKQWLWRTNLTREQVCQLLKDGTIARDWLVCPQGTSHRATTVETFVENADTFELDATIRESSDDEHLAIVEKSLREDFIPAFVLLNAFNFFAAHFLSVAGERWAATMFGVLFAEIGLLATWGVFSTARFLRRVVVSAAIGLIAYLCFVLGIMTQPGYRGDVIAPIFATLAFCPMVLLAVQAPLWVARIWLSCAIVKDDGLPRGSYLQPTRIQDLAIATACVGVVLTVARLGSNVLPGQTPDGALYRSIVIFSLVAGAVSAVSVVPLAAITLGIRTTQQIAVAVACWCVVAFAGSAVLLAYTSGITSGLLLAFLMGISSVAGGLCSGFLWARHHRYRLTRCNGTAIDASATSSVADGASRGLGAPPNHR